MGIEIAENPTKTQLEALKTAYAETGRRKGVKLDNFLALLREVYPISRIYYPGSWDDFEPLECAFSKEEIVYLEMERSKFSDLSGDERYGRNLIVGHAEQSPFRTASFDAIFMQDMHATRAELRGILRTLKKGGIFIFSTNNCGDDKGIELNDLRTYQTLSELILPFRARYYTAFQNVSAHPEGVVRRHI